ncbi:MAG TPA: ribosome biogenesis GTPase Der, partial [Bdellovibrionota bacterium]|nr:ribosome biogenesis GTPase Der [Bdellovibrionota bacterium]
MSEAKPLHLAIVGRPNVGKSTLFNRLFGKRRALVHNLPGVTRDRLEERTEWMVGGRKIPVMLIDTGGLGGERFAEEIREQVNMALQQADVVVALFDGQAGVLPADRELIRELKVQLSSSGREVLLVGAVNKVDAEVHESLGAEFYSLGIDPLLTLSAEHDRGVEDLKEEIVKITKHPGTVEAASAPEPETDPDADPDLEPWDAGPPKIAIIGRPNVGKSTMINALLGTKRMITSPIAGTTVDAVDSPIEMNGKPYILIDTAGIRRKSKTEQGVEVLSVVQARKALERAHVAVLLLDGKEGISDQDEKIGSLIEEAGCGVIIAVNKWDLQRSNQEFTRDIAAELVRKKMAYLRYAPVLFVSAIEGKGFDDLGELVDEILHQRRLKVTTREFTQWVRDEAPIHNPQGAKFYLCHQSGRNPPTFVCHVNDPDRVHFSLRRHLVNGIRERWGYMGNP